MSERHPTLQVLEAPGLLPFLLSRFLGTVARSLLAAALAWHIFDLTRAEARFGPEFWLGMRGLLEFLPVIPIGLLGGALADTRDRRDLAAAARLATLACGVALWWGTGRVESELALVYAAVLAHAVAWGIEFPANQAILPALVRREIFPNAVVVSAMMRNGAVAVGPVVAGFAIDAGGPGAAYGWAALLYAASLVALLFVPRRGTAQDAPRPGLAAVREGIAFVRRRPVVLSAMGLDMVAVILAEPAALLAVFAGDVLDLGPRGYGLLAASTAIGTASTSAVLVLRKGFRRAGRALVGAVLVFGAAATVFGASGSFPLSVVALMVAGAADQVSQVARSTLIQLSTPDALRGRVSAVNMVFISASNELGGAFSGFFAALTSAPFAIVAGGLGCVGFAAGVARKVRALREWEPPS
jgi:MFS family permease